jgi:hypothetical protein
MVSAVVADATAGSRAVLAMRVTPYRIVENTVEDRPTRAAGSGRGRCGGHAGWS